MSESTELDPEAPLPTRKSTSVLAKVLLALVAIVVVLAVVIAMQPAEFRVERSMTMAASPSTIFSEVNDFHNWEAWSP